jgi:hypothetical protein
MGNTDAYMGHNKLLQDPLSLSLSAIVFPNYGYKYRCETNSFHILALIGQEVSLPI